MPDSYFYGLHTVLSILQNHPASIRQLFLVDSYPSGFAGSHGQTAGRRKEDAPWQKDAPLQTIQTLARSAKIPVQIIPRQKLDQLANGGVHQGAVILLKEIPKLTEKDLPALLDHLKEPPFLLVLDGVQDPHNLGACLRSANAAGVHAVIVPKDNAASLTPVACKAASGAALNTPLICVTNLARTLDYLKKREIWVYGASGDATQTLYKADLNGAIAWVMGSESDGLRRLTQETCDALFSIPMKGNVSSLNVSVATGICLFEAVRQRIL